MVLRRWSKKEEKFLEENYFNVTAKDIGKRLGRSKMSVQKKAQKMNLIKEVKREYLPREEVVSRELRARVKMQEFKIDKNLGDMARVTIKSKFERGIKVLEGQLILKNNRFILVQTKNYRECINLVDVYTGQVVIS